MLTRICVFSHWTWRCLICGISGAASGQGSSGGSPLPARWFAGGPYRSWGGGGGPYNPPEPPRCSRGSDDASPWRETWRTQVGERTYGSAFAEQATGTATGKTGRVLSQSLPTTLSLPAVVQLEMENKSKEIEKLRKKSRGHHLFQNDNENCLTEIKSF